MAPPLPSRAIVVLIAALVLTANVAAAQVPPNTLQDGQTIALWPGPAPGALGTADSDIPALTVYLPRVMSANTPAVIICPGGAYARLAANHEGRQVANYLNSLGIARRSCCVTGWGRVITIPSSSGTRNAPSGC